MEIDPTTPSANLMEEEPLLEDKDVIKATPDKFPIFIKDRLTLLEDDQQVAKMKVALRSLKTSMVTFLFALEISMIRSLVEVLDD